MNGEEMLGMSAVYADGREELFNGLCAEPGVHMRVSFRQELGFPKKGFKFSRMTYSPEFGAEGHWKEIETIRLPENAAQILERLSKWYSDPFVQVYKEEADNMVQVLNLITGDQGDDELPMHRRLLSAVRRTTESINMNVLSAIMAAAIDTYVARTLGLYLIDIDSKTSPGSRVDYKVEGLWDDQEWPWEEVDLTNAPRTEVEARDIVVGSIRITSSRAMYVFESSDEAPGGIVLAGSGDLPLTIVFPHPVKEILLDLKPIGRSPANWQVITPRPSGPIITDPGEIISGRVEQIADGVIRITSASGRGKMDRIEIYNQRGNPSAYNYWLLTKLRYREETGPIGNHEYIVKWNSIAQPPVAGPVSKIKKAEVKEMPPILNKNGWVPKSRSQVQLKVDQSADVSFRTIRMHLRRSKKRELHVRRFPALENARPIPRDSFIPLISFYDPPQVVTSPGPKVQNKVEMMAAWPFDGTLEDSIWNTPARLRSLSESRPRPYFETQLDGSRQVLGLDGVKWAEVRDSSVFGSLGSSLILQAWVKPVGGGDRMTVLGNNSQKGFWFGLVPVNGKDYKLRFILNMAGAILSPEGRYFDSVSLISADNWSHIMAIYDGNNVRLYRNGTLEDGFPRRAPLGKVASNPANILGIGADPSVANPNLYFPFTGWLADVHIGKIIAGSSPCPDSSGLAACWHFNGDTVEIKSNASAVIHGMTPRYEDGHPDDSNTRVLSLDGSSFIEIPEVVVEEFTRIGIYLTIQAWIRPAPGERHQTIIDNNSSNGFALLLEDTGDGEEYRLNFWLKGTRIQTFQSLRYNQWSQISVTYDGLTVKVHINGILDKVQNASIGPLNSSMSHVPLIGAQRDPPSPERILSFFNGQLADLQVWADTLGLHKPVVVGHSFLQKNRERDSGEPIEKEVTSDEIPQYLDHWVPDGDYEYESQGVDIFGRVTPWSKPFKAKVIDKFLPASPVNVKAQYLPLQGKVTSVEDIENQKTTKIKTDILIPLSILSSIDRTIPALARYDINIRQDAEDSELAFKIKEARQEEGRLVVEIELPSLQRPEIQEGDIVSIEYDLNLGVSWGWTGRQRLFFPDTREFRIYAESQQANMMVGNLASVTTVSHERGKFIAKTFQEYDRSYGSLKGSWCKIGTHQYKILGAQSARIEDTDGRDHRALQLVLKFSAYPAISLEGNESVPKAGDEFRINLYSESRVWDERLHVEPIKNGDVFVLGTLDAIRLTRAEYTRLQESKDGPYWLPKLPDSTDVNGVSLYKAAIDQTLPVIRPDSYVMGALVGLYDPSKNSDIEVSGEDSRPLWHVFDVVWSDRNSLYFKVDRPDLDLSEEVILQGCRYYPGENYRLTTVQNFPPDFSSGEPYINYSMGITSADDQRETCDNRGDHKRYGNEGAVSSPVTIIAVDRRRPKPTDPPQVKMTHANYYGKSKTTISWESTAGDRVAYNYNIYRATDWALFTRDREQRRLKKGYYDGLSPDQVFGYSAAPNREYDDFLAWMRIYFPAQMETGEDGSSEWKSSLFVGKNKEKEWNDATKIWRAWAEWYYPSLTDDEVIELGKRKGNEEAFGLVNDSPVSTTSYVDYVEGLVSNRYLYGIRSISKAGMQSAESSDVGTIVGTEKLPRPPKSRPPTTPVFAKIVPGDRQVYLQWILGRDTDTKEFRLYRAEKREELEDLRLIEEGESDHLIDVLEDPRLKVQNAMVRLPGALHIDKMLGIFRSDEFDWSIGENLHQQSHTLNYYNEGTPTNSTTELVEEGRYYEIRNLRRIADDTSVTVVYRSQEDNVLTYPALGITNGRTMHYTDRALQGLRDYYYMMVAVDKYGIVSERSKIVRARALEIDPPPTPIVRLQRREDGDLDRVTLTIESEPDLEVMIQRTENGIGLWNTVTEPPWQSWSALRTWSEKVYPSRAFYYRVWSRTANNQLSKTPESLLAPMREGDDL